jgi:hypothetical protein
MRTRGGLRWSTTAVAGLLGLLVLTFGVGPQRADGLVRGLPRVAATAGHGLDASGLPAVPRLGTPSVHAGTVDAALVTAVVGVALLVLVVTGVSRPAPGAVRTPGSRPRAPPARH